MKLNGTVAELLYEFRALFVCHASKQISLSFSFLATGYHTEDVPDRLCDRSDVESPGWKAGVEIPDHRPNVAQLIGRLSQHLLSSCWCICWLHCNRISLCDHYRCCLAVFRADDCRQTDQEDFTATATADRGSIRRQTGRFTACLNPARTSHINK